MHGGQPGDPACPPGMTCGADGRCVPTPGVCPVAGQVRCTADTCVAVDGDSNLITFDDNGPLANTAGEVSFIQKGLDEVPTVAQRVRPDVAVLVSPLAQEVQAEELSQTLGEAPPDCGVLVVLDRQARYSVGCSLARMAPRLPPVRRADQTTCACLWFH